MDTLIILLKLLCAHLCSDFILQTDSINSGKREPGFKGIAYLLLHSITHAITAYLFVADWSCWLIPVIIFISHFIIDWAKCKYCQNSLSTFLADQFMHIAVIVALWFSLYGAGLEISYLNPTSTFPPQNFLVIQHLQFLHIYCGYYKFSNSTELG